jgi:thiamine-phosphate pyrophosphorylase
VETLYLVTDRAAVPGGDLVAHVERALGGAPRGSVLVGLREKDLGGRELMTLAAALREVTRRAGARLLVNDRVDVALAVGADGVQLPEDGMTIARARTLLPTGSLVGASAHSPEGAVRKALGGADLVTLSPVWATPSKHGTPPIGVETLAIAARELSAAAPHVRLFALGGIDGAARAREAVQAGAHGVAVIRAVLAADDPGAAAASLVTAVTP